MFGENLVEKAVESLAGGVIGYYNLPAYGRARYHAFRGNIIKYNKEEDYWKDAIGPYFHIPSYTNLHDGQLVELNNFEITEWVPRCPGLFWTREGNNYRSQASALIDRRTDKYIVYSPKGKTLMVLGGRGTTRLEHREGYKVLCATSSGRSDAGIPLVVSRGVYESLRNELQREGSICADLEGFYSQLPIDYINLILTTPGLELPANLTSLLANSLHIPKYCLRVDSRLLIKIRNSESNIQATAWTMFKPKENLLPYSFAFWSFDPRYEESIVDATDQIEDYIEAYGTGEILTDFDERVQRFASQSPLSIIMDSHEDKSSEQKAILRDIILKAEELQGIDSYS
jgi:hypothetical protein